MPPCGAAPAACSPRVAPPTTVGCRCWRRCPNNPTLLEFFEKRFAPANHVLQSATRALKTGMSEEIVMACLLHDVVQNLVKVDHGWWGAQMVEPYVTEKVSWAIRITRPCASTPTRPTATSIPSSTTRIYGKDYEPQPHIKAAYEFARNHKRYFEARMMTVNDLYAFDPNAQGVDRAVPRHHRTAVQAAEGRAGERQQPTAHMWRTMMFPDNPL